MPAAEAAVDKEWETFFETASMGGTSQFALGSRPRTTQLIRETGVVQWFCQNIDVGRVWTWGQWWWKRNGEAGSVLLTYVGGARFDALAVSGPRDGDHRSSESAQNPWQIEDFRRCGECWKLDRFEKHCTEDLREQVDRCATSYALAVFPLQLLSEANATVAAINGALAPRPDGIQEQMVQLSTDVVQLSAPVHQQDQRMSDFERQLKDVTAGRSCGSGDASSAASSEPHLEPARGNGSLHPPKNQRTVLVVGGSPYDMERDVMCGKIEKDFRT